MFRIAKVIWTAVLDSFALNMLITYKFNSLLSQGAYARVR
jgi:hypothetical protein